MASRSYDKVPDIYDQLVLQIASQGISFQDKWPYVVHLLGHADGFCHVYVDKSADMEMAKNTVLDAKRDYPVTSNAIVCSVKFLVDAGCAAVFHNARTRFSDGFRFGLGAEQMSFTEI
ncbi:uncharacterized protein LOC128126818 [Lactuca sativa]|uniref:uncharacterized protein LOC128126818 n=1 Tax=Lactuca sativa TaxID=4236 RepID=UPI000CD97F3F|nr:uncharacterized protein LOC128126818 [Lactuca sativa]